MKKSILSIESKSVALLLLTVLIVCSSIQSVAQSQQRLNTKYYHGLQTSFGRHSFKSQSNFTQINRSVVNADGGQIGLVFGSSVLRLGLGLIGYYSSVSNIAGSIDFYTNHAVVKFFPLSALNKTKLRIEPYVAGGISYDRSKFFGYYANSDNAKRNYSVVREEYVGSIRQLNSTVGAGFEFKVLETYDFIHLFSEVRYNHNLQTTTNRDALSATSLSNHVAINIGITFGRRK